MKIVISFSMNTNSVKSLVSVIMAIFIHAITIERNSNELSKWPAKKFYNTAISEGYKRKSTYRRI